MTNVLIAAATTLFIFSFIGLIVVQLIYHPLITGSVIILVIMVLMYITIYKTLKNRQ